MTTETTPSVDGCRECRAAAEQLVEGAVGWRCMRHGWQRRAVIFADRGAEAIRERDEAVALLRPHHLDREGLPLHRDCKACAFLSRFPESTEGSES